MKLNVLFFLASILLLGFTSCAENNYFVKSPDSSINIEVDILDGQAYYSINKGDVIILERSKISWSINEKILGNKISKIEVLEKNKGNTSYEVLGNHSHAINQYNSVLYKISSEDLSDFFLEVRAFNDGVAFRYSAENVEEVIINDFTEFTLPRQTKIWSQKDTNYYEGLYVDQNIEDLKAGTIAGPPIIVDYPDSDIYSAISESALYDFGGMAMVMSGERTFRAKLAGKTIKSDKIQSPWRVIMVGTINTLANNDIITNLSEETPKDLFAGSDSWLKPGKCVWSWMTGTGVSFENMKTFSKLGGELGFEYNLVDEGWSSWQEGDKDGWAMMKELVDYSAEQNVKIWAWKAYPDRKGIQGIQTPERRNEFFKKCKEIGIVGLKIDFFDSEAQEITKYYEETLRDAAKYGLMINFHGCNKPTGLNRTYPNEMTREGIRGYEYGMNVDCNVTLPLTRLLVGHGDYTSMYLNEGQMNGTSLSHQLATAIMFSSPLLCIAAHPADMINNPNREFISSLPTIWDETIVLPPSEIGKMLLLAKRSGKNWYIAGTTKEGQSDVLIDFYFLDSKEYQLHIIKDNPNLQNSSIAEEKTVTHNDKISVTMNAKGGFVAKITLK